MPNNRTTTAPGCQNCQFGNYRLEKWLEKWAPNVLWIYYKDILLSAKTNFDFIEERSPDVWWYDGQKITFRSKSTNIMLQLMLENPDVTIEELAKKSGIVTSAVKKQLQSMTEKGYIQRIGNDRNWYVFATQSI